MNRPVLIHVLLLVLALVTAYFVWTREPDTTEDEVSILSLRPGLDRVIYTTANRTVEVARRRDDNGSFHWVKVETLEDPPKPPKPPPTPPSKKDAGAKPVDGGKTQPPTPKKDSGAQSPTDGGVAQAKGDGSGSTAAAPPKPPAKIRKTKQFKGNKSLEDLIKGLAEFAAVRSLGVVDKGKLEQFGLAEGKKTLTLVAGSAPRTFIIGNNTFGSMDTYIQDKQDRRVYVIRPRLIQDFNYAEYRLMDRDLHTFGPTEVDRAVFSTKVAKKVLVQRNRRDPSSALWVDESAPDKRKDFFRNWMGRMNRLRTLEFVQTDKQPEQLEQLFTVEFFLGNKKLGHLRWYKGLATPSTPPLPKKGPEDKGKTEHYVETEHTRAKVKISRTLGEEVVRDLASLMQE